MKECVMKLLLSKLASNSITKDDIEFAFQMGYYEGRTAVLTEQIAGTNNKESKHD